VPTRQRKKPKRTSQVKCYKLRQGSNLPTAPN
jgi:hypothetical protein